MQMIELIEDPKEDALAIEDPVRTAEIRHLGSELRRMPRDRSR